MATARQPAPAPAPAKPRRRRRWLRALAYTLLVLLALGLVGWLVPFEYAYVPPGDKVANDRPARPFFEHDLWGRPFTRDQAEVMSRTEEGRERLLPRNGAVRIDWPLVRLGRRAFYDETFGNEVFLTDVLGALDGPLSPTAVLKALWDQGGQGTTNLRIEIAETVTVGGRTFEKGTSVDTGLDVPRGVYVPLGMTARKVRGRLYTGITCAACHSTVDPKTLQVIHGAPNRDLNAGLIMALATNSAAFFAHVDRADLEAAGTDPDRTVETADGRRVALPDPGKLEDAVDARLLKWPPGTFDSMVDLVAAPTKLPHAWPFGNHPYNWSGGFTAGPFKGLSVQTNNVHGLNSDATVLVDQAPAHFEMDPEQYLAILLQNAAHPRFRWDPAGGRKPSVVLAAADPTPGVPGLNEMVALPTYPKATLVAPAGVWTSDPGHAVWEKVNAMSAWQNTLAPPPAARAADRAAAERGAAVFRRAGCADCHAGPFGTNNRVVAADRLGTNHPRAKALKSIERILADPVAYAFDQPVPLPPDPRTLSVPTDGIDPGQVKLAFGFGDSPGGYKVQGLMGLWWTAPYLHDGGVAVGPDAGHDLGVPGTLLKGVAPDPANSLRALVDRGLRAQVVAANRAHADLAAVRVEGAGHDFWADPPAGFTTRDQDDLIQYLLAFEDVGGEQARK
jgi:hypothetical protein